MAAGRSYVLPTNSETATQAVKFLLVGLINTAVGLGTIYTLMWGLDVNPYVANMVGYSLALCTSYVLNRFWTFKAERGSKRQVVLFLAVFAISYAAQMGTLWLLITTGEVSPDFAQLGALIVYTTTNFIGNKFLTFKDPESRSEDKLDAKAVV